MKSRVLLVLVAMAVCGLAGCASGPESRIRGNPELFARLTPAQQELIKQGKVEVGFDEAMVRLAVGEPDRRWVRTEASGTSEVWSYTTWERTGGAPLYQGGYHGYYDPSAYCANTPSRREHEFFKVVLKEGKVTAVEQVTR